MKKHAVFSYEAPIAAIMNHETSNSISVEKIGKGIHVFQIVALF